MLLILWDLQAPSNIHLMTKLNVVKSAKDYKSESSRVPLSSQFYVILSHMTLRFPNVLVLCIKREKLHINISNWFVFVKVQSTNLSIFVSCSLAALIGLIDFDASINKPTFCLATCCGASHLWLLLTSHCSLDLPHHIPAG